MKHDLIERILSAEPSRLSTHLRHVEGECNRHFGDDEAVPASVLLLAASINSLSATVAQSAETLRAAIVAAKHA